MDTKSPPSLIDKCSHTEVELINPYELIRKYRCKNCNEVMMCSCDEEFGRKYLPHQLQEGTYLRTKERVKVTLGFEEAICKTCRGHKEEPAPKAEIYGATTKIRRYYWREIAFETIPAFAE